MAILTVPLVKPAVVIFPDPVRFNVDDVFVIGGTQTTLPDTLTLNAPLNISVAMLPAIIPPAPMFKLLVINAVPPVV